MKKYVLLVMASFMMFGIAMAQPQTSPKGKMGMKNEFRNGKMPMMSPQRRSEQMAKVLGLTDEEKVKVQALFEKQAADQKQLQAEVKKTRAEFKAKFESQHKAQDQELQSIIGQEKFNKLQSLRIEHMGKMISKMKHNGCGMMNDSTHRPQKFHRQPANN